MRRHQFNFTTIDFGEPESYIFNGTCEQNLIIGHIEALRMGFDPCVESSDKRVRRLPTGRVLFSFEPSAEPYQFVAHDGRIWTVTVSR